MMPDGGLDVARVVDRRMALAREWDDLVEQVRQIEGFEDFLRPPPAEKLLVAAAEGPVAVINVSRWRCDALLVRAGGVTTLPLPGLTADAVELRVARYLGLLRVVAARADEYRRASQLVAEGDNSDEARRRCAETRLAVDRSEKTSEAMLQVILVWLWEVVARPVLDALGYTGTPSKGSVPPRLWWCPTGLLTLLPLHAAGDYPAMAEGVPGQTVLDRVVSSYTPTLRALIEARKPLAPGKSAPDLLIVTVPDVPGEPPLLAVGDERDRLAARFTGRHTVLDGAEATVDVVLESLAQYRWVHFSCHGYQDLVDPSRGGLRLADGLLTIPAVSAGQYHGEFVFLSACKTATGGVSLADEAITLTSALHYTGYRHVIGTLWSVPDDVAAEVATAVYGPATEEFLPGASAHRLHEVLLRLRDTQRLGRWTPFTHTGP